MVTREMLSEMIEGTRPAFIFESDGKVQHWQQNNKPGILVATTREAADKFARKLSENNKQPVTVGEVGSIPGETLGGQIAEAWTAGGPPGIYVTDDGQNVYYFQPS